MTRPLPEQAKAALERLEGIEADMREFDGDKRGMLTSLNEAEEEFEQIARQMAPALLAAEELYRAIAIMPADHPALSFEENERIAKARESYRKTTGGEA